MDYKPCTQDGGISVATTAAVYFSDWSWRCLTSWRHIMTSLAPTRALRSSLWSPALCIVQLCDR